MSLKVRAILVVVVGVVLGLSLSVGGGMIGASQPPDDEALAWEQATSEIPGGHALGKPEVLFRKLEPAELFQAD